MKALTWYYLINFDTKSVYDMQQPSSFFFEKKIELESKNKPQSVDELQNIFTDIFIQYMLGKTINVPQAVVKFLYIKNVT